METALEPKEYQGSWLSYVVGFIGSLVCTGLAYAAVVIHAFNSPLLLAAVVALALLQLLVQLVFFLHLGRRGSGLNGAMAVLAIIIVAIVVVGSLWIMHNLDTRMMPSMEQMYQYMNDQTGL